MEYSVFARIFSYREIEGKSPLENYLTEIFAYCISNDKAFRQDLFLELLKVEAPAETFLINTQASYEGYGRPDIEIEFTNTIILFECKVEHTERTNQLKDYASILVKEKKYYDHKHLVYLTKYFEHKQLEEKEVKLHLIRWVDIYRLINNNHSQITNQLKFFLKEKNMESVKNFTLEDLMAMKTIPQTMTKMDELLEQFKPVFNEKFGGYSKDSSRSTRLTNSLYTNFVELSYESMKYWLMVGFIWWWGEEYEIPYVGLSLEIPKRLEKTDLIEILDRELGSKHNWEKEDWEADFYYSALKPVTDFIIQQDDNIPAMKKYIDSQLKVLLELQSRIPFLFRH